MNKVWDLFGFCFYSLNLHPVKASSSFHGLRIRMCQYADDRLTFLYLSLALLQDLGRRGFPEVLLWFLQKWEPQTFQLHGLSNPPVISLSLSSASSVPTLPYRFPTRFQFDFFTFYPHLHLTYFWGHLRSRLFYTSTTLAHISVKPVKNWVIISRKENKFSKQPL